MSEQKPPARDVGGTTAPGRPIPEQAGRAPVTAPGEVRPAVPEQAAAPVEESMPVEETAAIEAAAPERRRRLHRRRPRRQSAFRRWRKTRPFWGGFFTMLGGLEIAAITAASYELLFVSKSVGFAIAVGAAIAAIGLTMWLSPMLSKLLGLLTLVAALLSFVTSNLGGFLLGMLLSIIGGGLSFAWEPGRALESGDQTVENADTTPDADEEATPGDAGDAVGLAILDIPQQRPPHRVGELRPTDTAGD
jgi:hypothetical protein